MAKVQPLRIDLVRLQHVGTAFVEVADVDVDPGEQHALRWDLDLVVHVEDGTDPGLAGALDLRNDAVNGQGSGGAWRRPKDAIVALSLYTPEDESIVALEVDAKIRKLTYRATDKGDELTMRIRLPGLSIDTSAELLHCIGKTCRFSTVPRQGDMFEEGEEAANG